MRKALIIALIISITILLMPAAGLTRGGSQRGGRDNASWYIGFGVGGGTGWLSFDDGPEASQEGGVAVLFKVGGVLSSHLLLGFEAAAWRYQVGDGGVQFNHYDAIVTLFPFSRAGLFVKGGIGLGNTMVDIGGDLWGRSEAGFDFRLGAGYEFKLGRSFYLGVELDYASTTYEGAMTGDVNILVSFTWY